jgi:polar amino acid transport system substrate-binding protein
MRVNFLHEYNECLPSTVKERVKMITRRHFSAILGAAASACVAGSGRALAQDQSSLQRIKSSGKLRIGGIPDGAPYYQKSIVDGQWRGFYIDICSKLAAELGLELDITETTWGNSVLDLQAGKIDVFFGLNPTPERQKVIDFSGPVFKNAFSLVTSNSLEGNSWEDFNKSDLTIAVDAGSSHDAAVGRNLPNAKITRLKTQSDATAALQSGRADAQCLVLILGLTLMAKNPSVGKLVIPTPLDATTSNAGYRREEDKSWQNFVSAWIEENRANGFIKQAIVKNMELVGVKEADFPVDAGI